MKNLELSRYALAMGAVAALLAGCGGSQPIGAPGAMPQSRTVTTAADNGASWMLPSAKDQNLLYVTGSPNYPSGTAYVYTYPQGRLVGTLTGFDLPFGECSDSAGNVFILAYSSSSTIYEYAHGGASPIATLSYPGLAKGCAVDRATGNLAVSGGEYGYGGTIGIYTQASGQPKMYYTKSYGTLFSCSYDDAGNLYIVGWNGHYGDQAEFLRLSNGSDSFDVISLNAKIYFTSAFVPSVQWDGNHIAVTSGPYRKPLSVYRLRITGSDAMVISSATLTSAKNNYSGDTWIQGKSIIGTGYDGHCYESAFTWAYRKGGVPNRTMEKLGKVHCPEISAVTISLAQSR